MFYLVNAILFILLLSLIYYNNYILSNNDFKVIKFIIDDNYIKSEIYDSSIENFKQFLIPPIKIIEDKKTPDYCLYKNVECKFPIYKINDDYISVNNIGDLIDSFYSYLKKLNNNEKTKLKNEIGFNNYLFKKGKLVFNNNNYCNLKYGGLKKKKLEQLLPRGEKCDTNLDNCKFDGKRYYIIQNRLDNHLCNHYKEIELKGKQFCNSDLDVDFNSNLCLTFEKYILNVLNHIIDNNYKYIIQISNYRPLNILEYSNLNKLKES